jgi:hypothetical protein
MRGTFPPNVSTSTRIETLIERVKGFDSAKVIWMAQRCHKIVKSVFGQNDNLAHRPIRRKIRGSEEEQNNCDVEASCGEEASREAAKECSPRRKPWVDRRECQPAPKGRKKGRDTKHRLAPEKTFRKNDRANQTPNSKNTAGTTYPSAPA